ncbi:Gamma-tubulin complex component [Ooceraea biroi]|uniref:Gamma-tubulin complex component n=1 Tax=Ooceraea biroi TaxID=2015173 RepID=A0A026X082_OOCBI|nr:Gamma-tubulin complex component [Ooceraea biroi]
MDPGERRDANVYDLVTRLIEHTLRRNRLSENGNSYVPPKSDLKIVRRLRSKAYEILLNKSGKVYERENAGNSEIDPLVAVLKHTFVLKLSLRRVLEAEKLENLVNELYGQETTNAETVIHSILRLLIELKNFQGDKEPALDVFHYGKANPFLPEDVTPRSGVPMFQTYPMESFILPEKFEAMLGIRRRYASRDVSANFISRVSFENQHVSKAILGIETIRYNNAVNKVPCISNGTDNTTKQCNMIVPFLTHLMIEQTNKLYLSTQRFMSNTVLPCGWAKSLDNQIENQDHLHVVPNDSNHNSASESKCVRDNVNLVWEKVQSSLSSDCLSKLRTWECLGILESSKQSLFVTDLPETALHLTRIRQTSILSLLPKKAMHSVSLTREVSPEKFLSDVKLLLFGIDSNCFKHDLMLGFRLDENVTVRGVNSETLRATCVQAIQWGNNFWSLSRLVTPDPQTGKLQQDGLIFKAMCANVKELLLYYRSALQRIVDQHESHGLLSVLKKVRPLAHLIVEVARLCDYSKHSQCTLNGGSAILTHIYKEVTKVTNPKVALVLYSILKSCCEVYFRLLQNWLFEGTCDDVYGEFMIQAQSQNLRKRGRKFWTESFAIDKESVPGFLSELSESILQCGKTLRLLKICNPKNPVCNVSVNAQPEIKVCLSVSMLREQLLRCQEYEGKCEAALGPIVSLLSAIQDEKKAEKERAELVIRAQQETLSRITKQREELILKTAQTKRELLQELKHQAEESALYKEKEKELEILADKLLLEKINREQEEMREQQRAEREQILNYYDKLAADIESNRMRSNWRKARMNHFERRIEFLEFMKRQDREMSENIATPNSNENLVDADVQDMKRHDRETSENIATPNSNENLVDTDAQNIPLSPSMDMSTREVEAASSQDENSNFAENVVTDVDATDSNRNESKEHLTITESVSSESFESCNSDKDVASNKEVTTSKDSPMTADTQNAHPPPQESLPLNYIYKKNNERSNLQDFLREEAMKKTSAIMNIASKQLTSLDTCLNNVVSLEDDDITKKIIGTMQRPKSLAIGRVDNMTAAQANKLKVLLQEYGTTPNNNEFSMFPNKREIINRTNVNGNNQPLIDAIVRGPIDNEECSNKTNSADSKAQESTLSNAQQQNNIDTPMSCTTDNLTTLSLHTPLSQIPNSDDIFALNAGQEVSSLSDTGKSITEETCLESPTISGNFKLPSLFGVSPDARSSVASSYLTIADVEMIDHTSLQVYLEKSVIIPLQIQTRLINHAIIKYLLNEHNMLSHLHSLRSYFFLLNGEFAKSLTDSLYSRLYTISAPIELFNSATLTNLLEKALMNSFSNNYANAELLSLSAIDKPCQLYISDPNVLECLCLNYKISWPLNIIFDDTMMLQYSKVFKFLIMTGRMAWVLQEDFNIMKVERDAINSHQYHKLQLYRHSMTQFMNALHNYLTCSVLHASWNEFEKDLQNCRTIDQIYLSHMNYIKRILSRCMLNARGEKMRTCLINIFKIILKFHNRLRSQAWTPGCDTGQYGHPNFKSLEQMYQSFCEWRTYMAHVAHKLATSGYQPHLTHFLNALNINDLYDLTTKQQ